MSIDLFYSMTLARPRPPVHHAAALVRPWQPRIAWLHLNTKVLKLQNICYKISNHTFSKPGGGPLGLGTTT